MRCEVKMSIEFVGHRLCIALVIQQQVADEVGSAIEAFLDVSDGQVQIISQLRVRREVFIHAGHRYLPASFIQKELIVCLQQFTDSRLAGKQDFRQRPGNNHGIRPLKCMGITLDHLDAEHIYKALGDAGHRAFVADGKAVFSFHGKPGIANEWQDCTSRLNVGR